MDALGEKGSVFVGSILGGLSSSSLEGDSVALVLKTLRSNESLNPGSLGVWLLPLALGLDFATNNELANIIVLGQTEEISDLGSTLGSESLGMGNIGQSSDITITLLDNHEGEDSEISGNNTSTNRLALPLSGPAGAVTRVPLREEELDTSRVHDPLLHRKTLLVVTAGDLENKPGKFRSNTVTRDLLSHTLIHEDAEATVILDFNEFL